MTNFYHKNNHYQQSQEAQVINTVILMQIKTIQVCHHQITIITIVVMRMEKRSKVHLSNYTSNRNNRQIQAKNQTKNQVHLITIFIMVPVLTIIVQYILINITKMSVIVY